MSYRLYELLRAQKRANLHQNPMKTIPQEVDLEDITRGEFSENVVRKDFLPTEAAAIAKALESLEKERAKERQQEAGRLVGSGKQASGNLPEACRGRTHDKLASYVGLGRRTLEKIDEVVEAAETNPIEAVPHDELVLLKTHDESVAN